jgi:hypothetical protein
VSKTDLIVFGCPVANRSWVISEWWDAITKQTMDSRWKAAFVYSTSEDETLGKLQQMQDWHDVHIMDVGVSPRTLLEQQAHRWDVAAGHIEKMAEWRNMLLDYCIEQDADWFFSVDSDVILPSFTFERLQKRFVDGVGAAAPLVNMAGHLDAGSFAWNYMYWNDTAPGSAYRSGVPMPEQPFRVDVIMAAMLIHRSAFHIKWAPHDQGEDLGWSLSATEQGVKLLIDPTIVCNHYMRPLQ